MLEINNKTGIVKYLRFSLFITGGRIIYNRQLKTCNNSIFVLKSRVAEKFVKMFEQTSIACCRFKIDSVVQDLLIPRYPDAPYIRGC